MAALNTLEIEFLQPKQQQLLAELENLGTTHNGRSQLGLRLAELGDPRAGVGLRPAGLSDIA